LRERTALANSSIPSINCHRDIRRGAAPLGNGARAMLHLPFGLVVELDGKRNQRLGE
jgi:hypothetical protein